MPASRHSPNRPASARGTQQLTLPFDAPVARVARPFESDPPPVRGTASPVTPPRLPSDDADRVASELAALPHDAPLPHDDGASDELDRVRRDLALDDDFGPAPGDDDDDEVDRPRLDQTRIKEESRRLAGELRALLGHPVRLVVHDNRSTMVSFRREDDVLVLRIHHMFLDAGPEVVRALGEYSKGRGTSAGKVLDRYIRQHREAIRPPDLEREREKVLRTRGDTYDLQAIYDRLNAAHFDGRIDARIGWGRGSSEPRRRTIRMGVYFSQTATILIHPALDRAEVPAYFVDLVVFHEMLHQAEPAEELGGGRRCVHTTKFRARERTFPDYERARAWERRHLHVLLRPPRTRSPG